jgi:hypothetical protein
MTAACAATAAAIASGLGQPARAMTCRSSLAVSSTGHIARHNQRRTASRQTLSARPPSQDRRDALPTPANCGRWEPRAFPDSPDHALTSSSPRKTVNDATCSAMLQHNSPRDGGLTCLVTKALDSHEAVAAPKEITTAIGHCFLRGSKRWLAAARQQYSERLRSAPACVRFVSRSSGDCAALVEHAALAGCAQR